MNVSRMAEFIRSLRESKNLTQEQLGDMINVSRSLISKWETGSKIPAVDCLTALAKVFDITVDEIIYGERKNNSNAKDFETLSATIGEETDTIEDVYEPYLMQIGYIARTPRGRVATPLAYEHIGVEYNK